MKPWPGTIRPMLPSDAEPLAHMVRALCDLHQSWDPQRYDFLPDVVERYTTWFPARATDPASVLLVADNGRPVGFIVGEVLDEIPIYRTTRYGFIHDMFVMPEARGQGIAKALAHAAVERFTAMGVQQIRLETALANEASRRIFASCGFRPAVVQMIRTDTKEHA